MKFKQARWKVLLGCTSPRHSYRLGEKGIESNPVERPGGNGWWKTQPEPSEPRKPNVFWAASTGVWTAGQGRGFHPSALMRLHPDYCSQVWCPQHQKDMELLEHSRRRAIKLIRGLEQRGGKFKLAIRKKFFTSGVVRYWTTCAGKLWMPQPWQCSRPGWVRSWATWSTVKCPCSWQGGWD